MPPFFDSIIIFDFQPKVNGFLIESQKYLTFFVFPVIIKFSVNEG